MRCRPASVEHGRPGEQERSGRDVEATSCKGRLPGAKRLGGRDVEATSDAVGAEAVARGLPRIMVFVADARRPVDAASLGATATRVGGLLQLRVGGRVSDAEARQLPADVDRLFLVSNPGHSEVPWLLIAVSVALAPLGGGLLIIVRRRAVVTPRRGSAPDG